MSEIQPTTENLCDPYVLQLIKALSMRDDENERLTAAVNDLFAMIDEGLLVRDISNDSDPLWALNALNFIQRLAKAQAAVDKGDTHD